MMSEPLKKDYRLLSFISAMVMVCYGMIAWWIPRTNFCFLIVSLTVLFVLYMLMTARDFAKDYYKELLLLALLSRCVFLFSIPSLSDDYFRFMWDGILTGNGINPYMHVPASVNSINGNALPAFMMKLKEGMNSLPYYSPYPPLLQLVFYIAVKIGGYHLVADIVVFKILILLAEAGSFFILKKLLEQFHLPVEKVLLYALNPLVIIELTGNLHGEVFMIFFMLLSFYLLVTNRTVSSAIFLALAVSTKLLPLIFLPAILSFIGIKKGLLYTVIVLATVMASFLPFANALFIPHMLESVGYYYQKFEFNASIYYLLRWMGYDLTGFNLIYITGKLLPLIAFVLIMWLAFYKKIKTKEVFFERILFTLLTYYLLSLIVHPWYITLLVAVSVCTTYRFAFVWSALIMLTYSTYLQTPYHEILWVVFLEYLVLGLVIYAEIRKGNEVKNV
ncbi:MAG: hypothetical protein JWP81_2615 [Ferruginibacter sp.]|nr:hypothetical protein [Ferruginibacter sp.]